MGVAESRYKFVCGGAAATHKFIPPITNASASHEAAIDKIFNQAAQNLSSSSPPPRTLRPPLLICLFYCSDAVAELVSRRLRDVTPQEKLHANYTLHLFTSETDLLNFLRQPDRHIDCLLLEASPHLQSLLDQLVQASLLYPALVLQAAGTAATMAAGRAGAHREGDRSSNSRIDEGFAALVSSALTYHPALLELSIEHLNQLGYVIEQAITQYIQLSPTVAKELSHPVLGLVESVTLGQALLAQQFRLAEKLKERLGYLGVYYKRNPKNFLRQMNVSQKDELLKQLKLEYREIILSYFADDPKLNDKIDNFVNIAFFADVPTSQIVEIHMSLMDEFAKQLKLEGRSEEILLDYRLTLIDTLAHLCEMYRRSIPREE